MFDFGDVLADSPASIVALVVTLAACFYLRRKKAALFGLLLMLIPFDTVLKFSFGGPSISAPDLVIFYIAGLMLFNVPTRRPGVSSERFILLRLIGVYSLAILFVSILVHTPTAQGFSALLSRSLGVFVVLVTPTMLRSPKDLLVVMRFWSVGVLASCTVGVLQSVDLMPMVFGEVNRIGRSLLGFQLPFKRSVGIFSIYSYFGTYVLPFLAIALAMLSSRLSTSRLDFRLLATTIGLILLSVLITQSRSTWLALVLSMLVLHTALSLASDSKLRLVNFSVILLGLGLALILAPGMLDVELLVEGFVNMRKLSVDGRMEQWALAYDLFKDNVLLGIGPKQYKVIDGDNVLHNMYLLILLEHGLLGGISMIAFVLLPAVYLWRTLGSMRHPVEVRVYSAAVFAGLVGIYCEVSFAGGLAYISLWTTLGIGLALSNMLPRTGRSRQIVGRAAPASPGRRYQRRLPV